MGNKAIRAVRECGIAELRRLLDEVLLFFYLIFSLVIWNQKNFVSLGGSLHVCIAKVYTCSLYILHDM